MNGATKKPSSRASAKQLEQNTGPGPEVASSMGKANKTNSQQGKNAQHETSLKTTGSETDVADNTESGEEIDQNYAPVEVVQEEERLRKEREGVNKEALQDIFAAEEGVALSEDQFKKLDALIQQTNAYTSFLYEQMQENDENESEPAEGKVGGKRKGGSKAGGPKKRTKAVSKTQAFLPLMKGELRDYQLKGVRWIISLWQNGLNGILADQMGLGKTVQTIGFLSHLYSKKIYGPFMILGPLSTLSNWMAEFQRFCPSLKTVLYHGSKKDRAEIRSKRMTIDNNGKPEQDFPVVITSYEIVLADIKFMQKVKWNYIIVDEGHRLKNWNCKLLRELRTLPSANKLILSGTPLQNSLGELWSLLNFLMPDIFTSMSTFESWFDFTGITDSKGGEAIAAQEQRTQIVSKLHAILKPFLLRRIKSDVENSLPAKKEIILYAHMTDKQMEFNEQLRDRTLNEVMARKQKEEGGRQPSTTKLNNMIMQMRKNCNHPDLISSAFTNEVFYPSAAELVAQCGKLQLLDRLLKKLKAKGHKCLIFSQMTKMLDLLDTFLEQSGYTSCRLDGSVSWQDRQQAMTDFNNDPDLFCFLLSTRAGGLGINLTAADTVIIYDSDWNPHQDMQAMDRAHRIGQEKPVLVLRLATASSVEGRMLKRANSKLMLERLVIRKGAFLPSQAESSSNSLSQEELMELLKDAMPLKDEPQAGVVSDQVLEKLLDRTHLVSGKPAPYKDADVGYEVVTSMETPGLLSSVQ